jgi:hypothetical protein
VGGLTLLFLVFMIFSLCAGILVLAYIVTRVLIISVRNYRRLSNEERTQVWRDLFGLERK